VVPRVERGVLPDPLADEFFLTIAPKLLGGTYPDARNILNDALPTPQDLRLLSVHLAADELFLRYAITGPKTL
jgi:riboflavin biosynthesis pyrimidine reductase